eukprot:14716260-Alexandrium_andersonii.AAC.1
MDDLEARLGRMLERTANTLTDEFGGVSRKVDDMGMRFTQFETKFDEFDREFTELSGKQQALEEKAENRYQELLDQ